MVLESERRSLAAHLRPAWRPRSRYEDLSLVVMLARLERDWLAGGAMPWGAAPRTRLEADIDQLGDALERLGRWLSERAVAEAEGRARGRLAVITTGLGGPGPLAPTAVRAIPWVPPPDTPRFGLPSRPRAVAAAALLTLCAAAGALLIAGSEQGSGPGSAGRSPGLAALGESQRATNVQARRGSGQGRRGPDRPGDSQARSSARAGSQGSARSTSTVSEPVSAPPVPSPVAEPVAAPQPAPTPAPAGSPSSFTASQAKGAGGCPPEFGYEC